MSEFNPRASADKDFPVGISNLNVRADSRHSSYNSSTGSRKSFDRNQVGYREPDKEFVEDGVILDNVSRGYGNLRVIENLSMKVKTGDVFALLGPSGCGKTTLLKMILGRLEPDSGSVTVLGLPPHTIHHHIPGSRVGYAPQELALYMDLTIEETLFFHSKLHQMTRTDFNQRKNWLLDFLELPSEKRMVSQLSNGQQRRVSLAVALIHNPEILILDEPTVGLDPLLRLRMWDFFRSISASGVTILITTHYVEEARHADVVGLMRSGRLLAQGPPDALMRHFGHVTLEDVFLELCRNFNRHPTATRILEHEEKEIARMENDYVTDDSEWEDMNIQHREDERRQTVRLTHNIDTELDEPDMDTVRLLNQEPPVHKRKDLSWRRHPNHGLGLVRRKLTQLIRNPIALFFEVLAPTFQIFFFILCLGPNPTNLNFMIVNLDNGYTPPGYTFPLYLGDEMVHYIDKSGYFNLHYTNDLSHAIDTVQSGDNWGALYIGADFSYAFYYRLSEIDNVTIQMDSTVDLYMDLSNYEISQEIQNQIDFAMNDMASDLYGTDVDPVNLEAPIYGQTNWKFSDFLGPGMIALIIYAHSIGMTAVAFVREKLDSTMDRIFAAGVKPITIILAHMLTHIGVLLVQTGLLLIVAVYGFNVPALGNIFFVFLLTTLIGCVGVGIGLVISANAKNEAVGVQLAVSAFFPSLLISGVIWPIEAIPTWFVWISYCLPTTWSADAMRSVMTRGWGMSHKSVYMGILVPLAWLVFLLTIAIIKLPSRDRQWWWQRRRARAKLERYQKKQQQLLNSRNLPDPEEPAMNN